MRKKLFSLFALLVGLSLAAGCATSQKQDTGPEKQLTAGVVQKEIMRGMTQAEVAESLGSPNIVTRDEEGRETWIYDRTAAEASYSRRSGFGTILLLGFSRESGKSSSSQRTLTVVIKFDQKQKVDTFSFHSSRF